MTGPDHSGPADTPPIEMADRLSPSEAVYAFAAWLTSRVETLRAGLAHDAAPMARLVEQFCRSQSLSPPRAGWTAFLNCYPREGE